jgi:hypothetical protein
LGGLGGRLRQLLRPKGLCGCRLLDKFHNEVASTTNRVSAGIKKISELIDRSSSTLRLSPPFKSWAVGVHLVLLSLHAARTSWLIIMGLVGIILFLLFVVFFL